MKCNLLTVSVSVYLTVVKNRKLKLVRKGQGHVTLGLVGSQKYFFSRFHLLRGCSFLISGEIYISQPKAAYTLVYLMYNIQWSTLVIFSQCFNPGQLYKEKMRCKTYIAYTLVYLMYNIQWSSLVSVLTRVSFIKKKCDVKHKVDQKKRICFFDRNLGMKLSSI